MSFRLSGRLLPREIAVPEFKPRPSSEQARGRVSPRTDSRLALRLRSLKGQHERGIMGAGSVRLKRPLSTISRVLRSSVFSWEILYHGVVWRTGAPPGSLIRVTRTGPHGVPR